MPVGAASAEMLAILHAESFPPAERWTAGAIALLLDLPGHFALIAVLDDDPAGFAMGRATAGEAEVLTLAVRPSARRTGAGRALLSALVEEAADRGAGTLFLEVSDRNPAARALYSAAGATEAGRRRRYYPDGSDALVLRMELTPHAGAEGE